MTVTDPLAAISTRRTPQKVQADPRQERNHAGGYTFKTSDLERLRRFLVLGTTGGTYYQGERELTIENASLVLGMIRGGAARAVVDEVVTLSVEGRAPKSNPLLFALAAATDAPEAADRRYALERLDQVARTSTHLFTFARYLQQFRGWGPLVREHVGAWYLDKTPDALGYQVAKYRQRDGWTHRDILRKAHPKGVGGTDPGHRAIFDWLCGRDHGELPAVIRDFEAAQATDNLGEWIRIIERGTISWEMLPDRALTNLTVWEALIDANRVPIGALIRQLPRLTRVGVFEDSDRTRTVVNRLLDERNLQRGRIHPINVLVALRTYASGEGKGGTWTPKRRIIDTLDEAFYKSFRNVEPTGKRTLIALDVSGSMSWGWGAPIMGSLLPVEVATALSLVTAAVEDEYDIVGVTTDCKEIPISPRQRLGDAIAQCSNWWGGGTNLSAPFTWAQSNRRNYDTVALFTDNETWAGNIHPHQALESYRQSSGINTRFVAVGLTATNYSVADPSDVGSLNVAGFDSAVPRLISDFSRGVI